MTFFLAFVLLVVMLSAPLVLPWLATRNWDYFEIWLTIAAIGFYMVVGVSLTNAAGIGLRSLVQ